MGKQFNIPNYLAILPKILKNFTNNSLIIAILAVQT
jgi:hypothetical protein